MATVARKVEVEDHMESSIDMLSNAVRAIGAKLDKLSQKIDTVSTQLTSAIRSVGERIDRHWELRNVALPATSNENFRQGL